MRSCIAWRGAIGMAVAGVSLVMAGAVQAQSDKRQEALSATWPGMVEGAKVLDWEGTMLQEGSNGYTCMPTPPTMVGRAPMCLDEVWLTWAEAWQNREPYTADRLGFAYMLQGDEGASNIDPYAEEATEDNQWIEEGPHLMIIAPPELLEGLPTDPDNGGPYVMWKGTDYQHIMVPVGARDASEAD